MGFPCRTRFILVALTAALLTSPAFAGKVVIDSRPAGGDIEIDGNLAEWQDRMTFVKSERLYLGVANDDKNLYLAMASRDPDVNRAVVTSGLSVRFESGGGETLAIQYPAGIMDAGGPRNRPLTQQEIEERFKATLGVFTVAGSEKNGRETLPVDDGRGIEVACDASGAGFVYELKVPLQPTEAHPYAVDTEPDEVLRVTVDTPRLDVAAMREQVDTDRTADRMGGGYGPDDRTAVHDDLGPGASGSSLVEMPPSVRFKVRVRLAKPATGGR